MIHRMLQFPEGWEWHLLQPVRYIGQDPLPKRSAAPQDGRRIPLEPPASDEITAKAALLEIKRKLPEFADWIDDSADGDPSNKITVTRTADGGMCLCGTVIFQVSDDQEDLQPFHFWVTERRLVTLQHDLRLTVRLQAGGNATPLNECGSAPEALLAIVGVILQPFQEGLDGFETRLGELENSMRYRNRTKLIDVIFERRYELLHWSHLFIPIREIHSAAKEGFMEALTETDMYKRITAKLDRIETLLDHYANEMDTLIAMDDAISTFRGNDIMKTLTIFTALFTPATVAGALWGVNMSLLPWAREPWGFAALTGIVVFFTLAIYFWLWRKGWTGDLLHARKQRLAAGNGREGAIRKSGTGKRGINSQNRMPRASEEAFAVRSTAVAAAEEGSGLPSRSRRK
ncbi:magnesium transporter CorA family protein [Paenibacillus thailandensis]|uniref:Magnesium transporter CorA family protein n=1 Tax=Paenibacillus thailandensis TaxID=393250 RepID=A0ABW5QWX0_9BACL